MLFNLALALCASPLPPQSTIYVDASAAPPGLGTQSVPYTRLDFAMIQAPTNSLISVAPGDYQDTSVFLAGKSLTIEGAPGGPAPVVSGIPSESMLTISGGASLAITGLRFEGPAGSSAAWPAKGGAVNAGFSTLNLSRCSFANFRADYGGAIWTAGALQLTLLEVEIESSCVAEYSGGGLFLVGPFNASIIDSQIEGQCNTSATFVAYGGGAIGAFGRGVLRSSLTISGSTIDGTCTDRGGSAYVERTDLVITGSTITGTSDSVGGGMMVASSDLRCSDSVFEDCRAEVGGGLYVVGGGNSVVDACTFRSNVAGFAGSQGGGGIYARSDVQVTACTFEGNLAAFNGAARGGAISGRGLVQSCTFVGNRAGVIGGSVAQDVTGPLVVDGCIFADATVPGIPAVDPVVTLTNSLLDVAAAGVNITVGDPLFWGQGDYHLLPGSPAIDANDPNASADAFGTVPDVGRYPFDPFYCGPGCDGPQGMVGCAGVANSTGVPSQLSALGSLDLSRDLLILTLQDLPPSSFGFFIASQTPAFNPGAGGTAGVVCVGGSVLRFDRAIQRATPIGGVAALKPSLSNLPGGGAVAAGETWHFQYWHRDSASQGSPSISNLSPSLVISF